MEKAARQNGFWELKKLDVTAASALGLQLKSGRIVTGDYKVNKKKESIVINVYLYDTVTSELIMKRKYEGSSGRDIFDTIDNLIRSTSSTLVGRNITMGSLKVAVLGEGAYRLYINANLQKEIKKSDGFLDKVAAGENAEVSIRSIDNDKKEQEVYREFIKVDENKTYTISFNPDDLKNRSRRYVCFPVKLLEGGLGGNVGVTWFFTDSLGVTAMGGAVYAANTIIPTALAEVTFAFWKTPQFSLYASAGGFCYFSKSVIISPSVMLGFEMWNVFIEAGLRYSFYEEGGFKPMASLGCRF